MQGGSGNTAKRRERRIKVSFSEEVDVIDPQKITLSKKNSNAVINPITFIFTRAGDANEPAEDTTYLVVSTEPVIITLFHDATRNFWLHEID